MYYNFKCGGIQGLKNQNSKNQNTKSSPLSVFQPQPPGQWQTKQSVGLQRDTKGRDKSMKVLLKCLPLIIGSILQIYTLFPPRS